MVLIAISSVSTLLGMLLRGCCEAAARLLRGSSECSFGTVLALRVLHTPVCDVNLTLTLGDTNYSVPSEAVGELGGATRLRGLLRLLLRWLLRLLL